MECVSCGGCNFESLSPTIMKRSSYKDIHCSFMIKVEVIVLVVMQDKI